MRAMLAREEIIYSFANMVALNQIFHDCFHQRYPRPVVEGQ
jgi:hypothetical protein